MMDSTIRRTGSASGAGLACVLACVLMVGCSSSSSSEKKLYLSSFDQAGLTGVLMNTPLVFTFTADIDPVSVNEKTIRITTTINSQTVVADGFYEVSGKKVTWYPDQTSRVYPVDPGSSTTTPILPGDSGLNTTATGTLQYAVELPGEPATETVRSRKGQYLREPYASSFVTVRGPTVTTPGDSSTVTALFDADQRFYRDSIRVADVLAYSGSVTPPDGYLGWIANPISSGGENPLFLWPSWWVAARDDWTGRDRTGAQVDTEYRIRLLPEMTVADMGNNVFPPGVPQDDERFISNWQGLAKGRQEPVDGIELWFTQPIAGDSFLNAQNQPKPYQQSPLVVKVLPKVDSNPALLTAEPFTLTYLNISELQAAVCVLSLNRVVKKGWIWIEVRWNGVKGMPGGRLEPNLSSRYVFQWPVELNAP